MDAHAHSSGGSSGEAHSLSPSSTSSDALTPNPARPAALELPTSPPPPVPASTVAAAPSAAVAFPLMHPGRDGGLERVIETSPDAGSVISPQQPLQQQQLHSNILQQQSQQQQSQQLQHQRARSISMSRRSVLSPAAAIAAGDVATPVFGSSPGAQSSARAAAVAAANAALAAEDAAAAAAAAAGNAGASAPASAIPASAGASSTPAASSSASVAAAASAAMSPRTAFRLKSPRYAAQTMSPGMFAQAQAQAKQQQEDSGLQLQQQQQQLQLPSNPGDRRPSQLRLLSPGSAASGFSVRFDDGASASSPPIAPLSTTATHARRPSNAHRRGTSFASFAMFTPSAAQQAQPQQQQARPSMLSRRGSVGPLSSSHQAAAAAAAAAVAGGASAVSFGLTTPAGPMTTRGSGSSSGFSSGGGGSGGPSGSLPAMLARRKSIVGTATLLATGGPPSASSSNLTSPAGSIPLPTPQQQVAQGSTPQQGQSSTPSMQHHHLQQMLQMQAQQQALMLSGRGAFNPASFFTGGEDPAQGLLNNTGGLPFEVDLAVRDVLESGEVVDLGGGGGGGGGTEGAESARGTGGAGIGGSKSNPVVLAARAHARAVERCFEFLLLLLVISAMDSGLLLGSLINLRSSSFSSSDSGSFAALGFLCVAPALGLALGGALAPSAMRRLGDEGAARFVGACIVVQGLCCAGVGMLSSVSSSAAAAGMIILEIVAGMVAAPLALFVPAWIGAQAACVCVPPAVPSGAQRTAFNPFVALSRVSLHWTSLARLSAPAGLALGFLLGAVSAIQDEAGSSGRGRGSWTNGMQSWGWSFVAQGCALFLCGVGMLLILHRSKLRPLMSLRPQSLPLMMSPCERLDSEALSRAAALREYETALRREALVQAINASAAAGGGAGSPSASVSVRNKARALRVSASPSKHSSSRYAADSTRSVSSSVSGAAGGAGNRFALDPLTVSGMTPHPYSLEEGFGFESMGSGGGAGSTTSAGGGGGQRFVSDGSVALAPHMSTSFLGSPQWLSGAGGTASGLHPDPSPSSSLAQAQGSMEILRQSPANYTGQGFAPDGTPLAQGQQEWWNGQQGVMFEPFGSSGGGFDLSMDPYQQQLQGQQTPASEDPGAFSSLDFANLFSLRFRLLTPSLVMAPLTEEEEDRTARQRARAWVRTHLSMASMLAQNGLYISSTLALVCAQFLLTGMTVWIAPLWLSGYGAHAAGVHWASVSLAWLVVALPSAAVGIALGHRAMRGLERRIDRRFDHDEAMRLQLDAIDQAPSTAAREGRAGSEANEDGNTPEHADTTAQMSVAPPRISADTEGRKIRLLSNHVCLLLLTLSTLLGVACILLGLASSLTPTSPFLSFSLVAVCLCALAALTPCILWIQEGSLCMLSALASTNHAAALICRGAMADPVAAEAEGERLAAFAGRTSQLLQMIGGFLIPPVAVGAAMDSHFDGGSVAGSIGDLSPGLVVLLWFVCPLFLLLALLTWAQRVQCAREQHAEDLMRESQQRQVNEQWGFERERQAMAFVGSHTSGGGEHGGGGAGGVGDHSSLPPPSAAQLGAAAAAHALSSCDYPQAVPRRFSDALPAAGEVPSWSRRGSVVSYETESLDAHGAPAASSAASASVVSPLSGPRSPNAFDQFASSHPASQAAMHRALAGTQDNDGRYGEQAGSMPRMFRSGSIEDSSRPGSRMGGEGAFEVEDTGEEDADFMLYGRAMQDE